MAFNHGIEIVELSDGNVTISEVASAVIGIVGTAPLGDLNKLILAAGDESFAALGSPIAGFTIPKALEAVRASGAGTCIIVNVYDPALHNQTVSGEVQAIDANGFAQLDYAPMAIVDVKNQAGEPMVEGTHYTLVNDFGKFKMTPRALNGITGVTEVLATTTVTITGGTSGPGVNKVTSISVGGVNVLGVAVDWVTSNNATATAVAAQITSFSSSPNWTATALGNVVTITAPVGSGATLNGQAVVVVAGGDVTYTGGASSSGGVTAVTAETPSTGLEVDYDRFDETLVDPLQIIGEIDGGTEERSGLKLLELAKNTFGAAAKIIICPGYSTVTAVSDEMAILADKVDGIFIIDAPEAITPSSIISSRGPMGTINFNVSNDRAELAYPMVTAFDKQTGADELRAYSQYMAATIAANDAAGGASYAKSPSNLQVKGITGVERVIQWNPKDPTCVANQLNAVGIRTLVSGFGTGFLMWGNRNSSFPANADPKTFTCVRRTADILHESVMDASRIFLDKEITQALIDSVIGSVMAFMGSLEANGRLMPGSTCTFDKSDNPISELKQGHVTFRLNFLPPIPAERITYKSFVDINLLGSLAA